MVKITLEVTEELSEKLEKLGDRLLEVINQSLEQRTLPAYTYRYVLNFLASNPTDRQISEFGPTLEMQAGLKRLLLASKSGVLTESERLELDEYERIERLIVILKSGNLKFLRDQKSTDFQSMAQDRRTLYCLHDQPDIFTLADGDLIP
jgi:hypothetical protein